MPQTRISKYLNAAINCLHQRKWLTFLLIALYTFGIFALHNPLVNLSITVMNFFGLEMYNLIVSGVVLVVSIVVGGLVIFQLIQSKKSLGLKIGWILILGILLVIHYLFLLEMNIEIIHSFAYGGLVFLLFAYFKRFGAALFFGIIIMLVDEYYQYIYLYPDYVEYWELNDVILDILGAIFMLMLIFIADFKFDKYLEKFYKRIEFWGFTLFILCFFILEKLCIFASHISAKCDHTLFVMSHIENYDTFWHEHDFTGKIYYILSPTESFILIGVFGILMIGLDSFLSKRKKLDFMKES